MQLKIANVVPIYKSGNEHIFYKLSLGFITISILKITRKIDVQQTNEFCKK